MEADDNIHIFIFLGSDLTCSSGGFCRSSIRLAIQLSLSLSETLFRIVEFEFGQFGDALVLVVVEYIFGRECRGIAPRHPRCCCDHRHCCVYPEKVIQ